jgi:hypothetical protein
VSRQILPSKQQATASIAALLVDEYKASQPNSIGGFQLAKNFGETGEFESLTCLC